MTTRGRVEAAAAVLYDRVNYPNGLNWDDGSLLALTRDRYRAHARAVLTAADTADRYDVKARGVILQAMLDAGIGGLVALRIADKLIAEGSGVIVIPEAAGAGAPGGGDADG